jgi:NAD-dependent dihydropyrimidine dehydrogenase PreA subunit
VRIQVNPEECDGCGACVEACKSGALQIRGGVVVLDRNACTECGDCVDVCLVGGITAAPATAAVPRPAVTEIVPATKAEVVESGPANHNPWLNAALAFAGREILPRLADSLMAALDRRLSQAEPERRELRSESERGVPQLQQTDGRGRRRRIRYGRGRPAGQGRGRGPGKRRWSQVDDARGS